MMHNFITFFVILLFSSINIQAQHSNISLTITNGLPKKGSVLVALYQNEKGFPGNDKKSFKSTKGNVSEKGITTITFSEIPPGEYAISVFQDENNDGILNTNMVGIPKEGYGFSNDAHKPFGPPEYKDCTFQHKGDTKLSIKLKRW